MIKKIKKDVKVRKPIVVLTSASVTPITTCFWEAGKSVPSIIRPVLF